MILSHLWTVTAPLAAAVLLALGGCGAEPTTGPDPAPDSAPADSAPDAPPDPEGAVDDVDFASPSGTISCSMIAVIGTRCDVDGPRYAAPPRPADCDGQWARSASIGSNGPGSLQCVTDSILGPHPVLEHGESAQVGDYLCTSRPDGVSCENTVTGNGFEISPDAYRVY